jgi:hypothetical protein
MLTAGFVEPRYIRRQVVQAGLRRLDEEFEPAVEYGSQRIAQMAAIDDDLRPGHTRDTKRILSKP